MPGVVQTLCRGSLANAPALLVCNVERYTHLSPRETQLETGDRQTNRHKKGGGNIVCGSTVGKDPQAVGQLSRWNVLGGRSAHERGGTGETVVLGPQCPADGSGWCPGSNGPVPEDTIQGASGHIAV